LPNADFVIEGYVDPTEPTKARSENCELLAMAISNNDDAHEIPSPPSGERESAPEDHRPARRLIQNRVVAGVAPAERWNKDSIFRPNRIN